MLALPSVEGLGWSKVRAIARELAGQADPDEVGHAAVPLLDASQGAKRRMLGVYLLGFTAGALHLPARAESPLTDLVRGGDQHYPVGGIS